MFEHIDWGVVATFLSAAATGFLPLHYADLQKQLKNPLSRARIKSTLEKHGPFERYQAWLSHFNEKTDEIFGVNTSRRWLICRLATLKSFGICLTAAYVYPMLVWLIAWIFGASPFFAGRQIMPDIKDEWFRLLVVLTLFLFAGLFGLYVHRFGQFSDWITDNFCRIFQVDTATAPPLTRRITGSAGLVGAVAIAGCIAGAGAIAIVSAIAGAGAILIAGVGAVAVVVVVAVAVAVAGVVAIAFAIAGAIALAGAGVDASVWVLFLIALPLANASVDGLSLLITRFFLKRASSISPGFPGALQLLGDLVADFTAAFICLVCLAALLPNVVIFYNSIAPAIHQPAIAWTEYLNNAVNDPWGHGLFVWLMLLTTMVPTFVHLSLGLTAVFAAGLPGPKHELLDAFPEDENYAGEWEDVAAQQRIARYYLFRQSGGFLFGSAVTLFLVVTYVYGAFQLTDGLGYTFQGAARCAASWHTGSCPWFE